LQKLLNKVHANSKNFVVSVSIACDLLWFYFVASEWCGCMQNCTSLWKY